jgi:hypothetical protein
VELANLADELYGLPPQEFTAARDARAAEARKAGEKDLATALKQLRKPSTGAWVANQLVREQPRAIKRLIDLGATLRSARNLEGAQIREATKEKAGSVAKLVRQARSIAEQAGQSVSQSAEQELESTLDAAFSDEDSAAAISPPRCTIQALALAPKRRSIAGPPLHAVRPARRVAGARPKSARRNAIWNRPNVTPSGPTPRPRRPSAR